MDLSKYKFVFNAAAYFNGAERFMEHGGMTQALVAADGAVSFDALCFALAEMSRQGAITEKYMTGEQLPVLEEDEVRARLQFREIKAARDLIIPIIVKGIRGDEPDENEDRDLVLEEIDKEKKAESD